MNKMVERVIQLLLVCSSIDFRIVRQSSTWNKVFVFWSAPTQSGEDRATQQ